MRREYFTLHTQPGDDAKPTISIEYDGPEADLQSVLRDDAGEVLPAEALDVTCRLLDDGTEGACVVGLTHRLTGEFLLEVNADARAVLDLVDAARANGDEDASYRVRVESEETSVSYDKETLLVYDGEGNLLRGRSLIPSGVEL
jgi:hypothetical protein